MDLDQLKQILDLVREHELSEFEIEHEGLRLKIRKDAVTGAMVAAPVAAAVPAPGPTPAAPAGPLVQASVAVPPSAEAADIDIELAVVKSPIVGTFYRAPEPGASDFVEIGASVKKGQVLCIIEAMKLMNEIDSEYDGEVVNVYVENGQPVQYGERLFAIRTKS
ncbi:MAG TPA: acetyl-CoA carboxylase biotin carboxyl carrier protein [Vicinamibacterales bacterium]|jgi:acetyl-CoA carboxylase biotin carboxyl carrier protein|nr:acetyl-CoA carboxylase biotin carboxyl carrier protein [Vicinamibacterales bacterium]